MGDSYIEVLIERDRNKTYFLEKIVSYVVAIILFLLALSTGFSPFLIGGIVLGVVGIFVVPNPDYEFEYLLLNKELSVDKIIAKSKRKSLASYDLNKMEIMCPLNSHELDRYRNNNTKVKNFSSDKEGITPYVIVYHGESGDELVYVEPDERFISAVKNLFPRKVLEY